MRRSGCILLAVCWLLLVGSYEALAQPLVGSDPTLKQPAWQRLGPIGPRAVTALAISPDYPDQKLILALRHSGADAPSDVVRSPDGGQTWESLPAPAQKLVGIQLAAAPGSGRIALAWSETTLFRSADAGDSWKQVLELETGDLSSVALSPNIAADGLLFVLAGGALWRSTDAALRWTSVNPAAGQYVQQVRFSPDFASDHSLFVAMASGPLPVGLYSTSTGDTTAPSGEPDASAGVAVSTDAGESWTPLDTGLEVDGAAYQAVEEIDLSPTFARDGTMFAYAWGPFDTVTLGTSELPSQRAALFRSHDRGLSWQPIQTFGPMVGRDHLRVAPSPHFSDDNVVLEAIDHSGVSPASSHCTLVFSDDAGDTWTEKLSPGAYDWCQFLQTFGAGAGFEATVLKSNTRYWSPDGGRTWGLGSTPFGFQPIVPSPSYARDQTLFIGGVAGVWVNGPGVVATNAMVPCAATPVLGFERVWSDNTDVRAAIGCPNGAERPVLLHVREFVNEFCGPTRVLWLDDPAFPDFYELSDDGCGPKYFSRWDKLRFMSRVPDVPEQLIQAVVQSFDGGKMLFVPSSDVDRTIIVLQSDNHWAEYPDP